MEIKKGNTTVRGNNLIEVNGNVTCGCGKPELRMVCHLDGKDFYGYTYNCKCGNVITVETKRSKEEQMFWV